jgi:glucose/arabinose dehydrogenase
VAPSSAASDGQKLDGVRRATGYACPVRRGLGVLAVAAAVACTVGGSSPSARVAGAAPPRLVEVASGLERPVHVTSTPSERGRLYVVEKAGRILVLENGSIRAAPFLDIRELVGSTGYEQGLLSVAFHPDYAENHRFYVDYTDTNGDTRVVEYRSEGGRAQPRTARQLLFVDQPYENHNGGQLAFDQSGRLYVGMGDGGSGGDPENRAQNLASPLGKLLRVDVDQPRARWRVVAYGLRNPWRFSFDRATGDLWIGDVGESAWEEIDYAPRGRFGLVNYGWDVWEGRHRFERKRRNPAGRLVGPVVEYSHDDGCSVTGGFVYRGDAVRGLRGRYVFGDYCSGTIWSVALRDGLATGLRREPVRVPSLSSFGEDVAGELYAVSDVDGTVYRLGD